MFQLFFFQPAIILLSHRVIRLFSACQSKAKKRRKRRLQSLTNFCFDKFVQFGRPNLLKSFDKNQIYGKKNFDFYHLSLDATDHPGKSVSHAGSLRLPLCSSV